jgi:tetratricopeptide (TPR) repeat protein
MLVTFGGPYSVLGFENRAKELFEESLKLTGDSADYFNNMIWVEEVQENFKEAIKYAENALRMDSLNSYLLATIGECYLLLHQKETALYYYRKYTSRLDSYKGKTWLYERTRLMREIHRTGYAYWITGNKVEAEKYFDKQKSICEEAIKTNFGGYGPEAYYDLAAIYAIRGEKEKAYENLHLYVKKAFSTVSKALVWFFKYDPFFDSIRMEPEFQAIFSEVKANYERTYEKLKKLLEEKGIL